jgi:hypothetical protein
VSPERCVMHAYSTGKRAGQEFHSIIWTRDIILRYSSSSKHSTGTVISSNRLFELVRREGIMAIRPDLWVLHGYVLLGNARRPLVLAVWNA